MKIRIFIFFSLLSIGAHAQEFFAGPKAAFSVNKARFDIDENKQFFNQGIVPGFNIGGAMDWPVHKMLNFYTELLFTYGGKSTEIVGTPIRNISHYYSIEVPVLFRLRFNGGKVSSGSFKWHFDVGPSLSYWLGGNGKLTNGTTDINYKIKFGEAPADQSNSDMYITNPNRWQWAFNVGIGLEYPIKELHWVFVDFRTVLGQSFITERDGSASSPILGFVDDTQVNSLSLQISVNYMYEVDLRRGNKGKSTIKKRKQY